jgi:hypothetical protein
MRACFEIGEYMADIFDKIAGGIDKGIKTVSSKSRELIETSKLRGEIRDVRDLIQNKFQALGKKVFEMINKGTLNEEDIRTDSSEIAALYKKITDIEEQMKKIELEAIKSRLGADTVKCLKCNEPNTSGSKFCIACGSPMAVETAPQGKACPTCGAALKEDAKFCVRCGKKIE